MLKAESRKHITHQNNKKQKTEINPKQQISTN
jgi:hypothetical protein